MDNKILDYLSEEIKAFLMPRKQYFDQLVTPFSYWHRNQHNGIAYSDIDQVSLCPACAAPLFLADHIYNKDNQFRSKSEWLYRPYKILAKAAKIPFFTIYIIYFYSGNAAPVGCTVKSNTINSAVLVGCKNN